MARLITSLAFIVFGASPFFLITNSSYALPAGFDFRAEVDNPAPVVGERFTYTVVLSGPTTSLPDIAPPDFKDLEVVVGPSISTSVQIVNANISTTKTLTFVMRAQRSGTITIEPAYFNYKGHRYTSNSITLQVKEPPTSSNPPSSTGVPIPSQPVSPPLDDQGKPPEVFLAAQADKSSLFTMEQATVSYYLYLRVNASNYNIDRVPQAVGFLQEELEVPQKPILEDVSVKGEHYKRALIRKVALFPTRPGSLTLEPMACEVTIQRPIARRRQRDPFDFFFDDPFFGPRYQNQVVNLRSEALTFKVSDPPMEGRPPQFKGDVGDYQVSVEIDKTSVPQSEPITIKVTVSGRGYVKTIEPPVFNLPSDFDRFPPTTEEKIAQVGNTIRGKKVFTYIAIPRRAGKLFIPPVEFSYFDPEAREYKLIKTGGQEIEVTPSLTSIASVSPTPSGDIITRESDIRFIKNPTRNLKLKSTPLYNTVSFYLLLAIPPFFFLLGLGGEWVYRQRSSNPVLVRRRKALSEFHKALRIAKHHSSRESVPTNLNLIAKPFQELIAATFNLPSASVSEEEIVKEIRNLNLDSQFETELISLWRDIEKFRFTGVPLIPQEWNQLIPRLEKVSETLTRQVWSRV